MSRVEGAENALSKLGFSDFRVRVFHNTARLQLKQDQMVKAVLNSEEIRKGLAPYFEIVTLDLEPR